MSTSRDTKIELPGAEHELYQLLAKNFYSTYSYNSYNAGHQERMSNINRVLASDGGKETVAATIKLIAGSIADLEKKMPEIKSAHHDRKRKHPFKTFLGDDKYYEEKNDWAHTRKCLITIKDELTAANSLNNVIEQAAFKKTM